MRGEWAFYESLLSEQECRDIIAAGTRFAPQTGTVGGEYGDGSDVEKTIRHGEVVFLQRTDPQFAQVFHTLDYCVNEANDQWFGVRYNPQGARSLQFSIYRGDAEGGGHFYNTHQDTSLISADSPTQRKLSVVVQLSDADEYEGGDFQMHHVKAHPPADSIRKRGTVLIFPSLLLHRVTPVTSGVRYSLVGWYVGPPWK
ncbi:MAG: 2OG-Fe(II) oxygenase [Gammaproteobacteria bacterium]|nr:2OG-Fe(II) oxygenase [Gammaproteobacteria bacterium]CAJ2377475.1 MAG: 2OG-Fe(II) oxygenase [Arenicellales bacterium IbO2]MDA7962876.1 2OG-Fe(II) oxygenase [Gammaproteobacteria bacterium]MDA7967709.1 2OG-Fe(II) oxygenase [Gammaproteobacteria bacterium]MDA7970322.1 2OG-Fe(II) oxygenase [Gammaproteobacteria bacterium]